MANWKHTLTTEDGKGKVVSVTDDDAYRANRDLTEDETAMLATDNGIQQLAAILTAEFDLNIPVPVPPPVVQQFGTIAMDSNTAAGILGQQTSPPIQVKA